MPPLPDPPAYGHASVSQLLPDAVELLAGGTATWLRLPEATTAVIMLVVDGLGQRQLDRHAELAPFLAGRMTHTAAPDARAHTVDAPFPTTTTTSLTSIGTGVPPGQHGIVGYSLAVEGDDRPLVALTWSWVRQDLDLDARDDLVPEQFQPHTTVFERAAERGVRAVTVLRPEFVGTGLTRAALRGGDTLTAVGLDQALAAAIGAASADGPAVVYAHHGDLDAAGHLAGPGSDRWCSELVRIDATLARITATLPDGVALVVTADHGMIGMPPDGFVELADAPALLDGVRVLAGDSRARQLYTRPGAAADVLASWRETFGEVAHVTTRDEAIQAGWFGPVADRVRPRIGDVVVCADALDVAWVHRDADLYGGRLAGLHGALTAEEREVPALVLTRGEDG